MVRETFGEAVDNALAQLEYAGVPRDAVAVIRQRLRRDKRIVAAVLKLVNLEVRDPVAGKAIALAVIASGLREALKGLREREGVGV